jgi:hypothetical protein
MLGTLLFGVSALPRMGTAQPSVQLAPGTTLFQLDLSGTPIGEFPTAIKQTKGSMAVVLQGGVPMLKASAASEFLITLPQVLPQDFTLEFDLVPKQGSNPQDLSFEGTPTINQGTGSAHLLWHATGYLAVIGGGGENYETPMPEALRATLPGVLTHVVADFQGPTIKLYTNGQRHYTLDKQFARGRVLRVFLGGQDDGTEAVYLAGLRVSTGSGLGIVAAQAGLPTRPAPMPPVGGGAPSAPTGQQLAPLGNSPLPVVNPPATQQLQTATQSFGLTGGPVTGAFPVTVTMGANGPLVSWPQVPNATGYTVGRSKSDDLNCCNAMSGRTWGAISPWQDGQLPIPGNYVYTVIANLKTGAQVQGQTQFAFGVTASPVSSPSVTPPIAASAGIPASAFAITVTMGASGPVVTWPSLPNASAYAVGRWKIDDPNCCNNSSGRGYGATSPWQDQPLPMSGTYVYRVEAVTPVGSVLGETQFGFRMPGGSTNPTTLTAIPVAPVTGTITPLPAPAPAPAPAGSTILTPTRPSGVSPNQTTWTNTGPAPAGVSFDGTPIKVSVIWSPPSGAPLFVAGSGISYTVSRAVAGSTNFAMLTATPITTINFFDDVFPDHRLTYTYAVTAHHSDGTSGTATADYTPPPPADPTNFAAIVKGIDEVELTWSGTPGPAEYFITGPGTGNGVTVPGTPGVPVHPHRLIYVIKGLPAGTHTWKIASSYTPGGVLTTPAQWPAATATLALAGKYEISVESVKASSEANDDLFHGDGLRNEFYVTAWVRTKDKSGNVLRESSYRSATHGDITNWPPPARVRAGSAGANGGVWSGDLISPVWDTPTAGATGWSRLVLWSGTLTAGVETVDVVPAVWEADNAGFRPGQFAPSGARFTYEDLLRQVGYSMLDLNTRTAYGDISNVMLATEHRGTVGAGFLGFHIGTEEDRPIGIAKEQDALNDAASWFPIGIGVTQTVAEAALSGAYGPPGLIPIQFVDHGYLSRLPITHPDLGMGNYTLNIRITRLP